VNTLSDKNGSSLSENHKKYICAFCWQITELFKLLLLLLLLLLSYVVNIAAKAKEISRAMLS